eukprot:5877572-Amphidinium_carterae.2
MRLGHGQSVRMARGVRGMDQRQCRVFSRACTCEKLKACETKPPQPNRKQEKLDGGTLLQANAPATRKIAYFRLWFKREDL